VGNEKELWKRRIKSSCHPILIKSHRAITRFNPPEEDTALKRSKRREKVKGEREKQSQQILKSNYQKINLFNLSLSYEDPFGTRVFDNFSPEIGDSSILNSFGMIAITI